MKAFASRIGFALCVTVAPLSPALAQLGLTLPCSSVDVRIDSVRDLGQTSVGDSIEVKWSSRFVEANGSVGTLGGFNTQSPASACFNTLGGATTISWKVDVEVTRQFGNVDSASASVTTKLVGSGHSAIVKIPRGLAETDPKSYKVKVTKATLPGSGAPWTTAFTGQGAPSTAATRTVTTSPLFQPSCLAQLQLSQLALVPGSGTTKDRVTASWTIAPAEVSCFKPATNNITASVKRSDGSSGFASVQLAPGATSASLDLSGTPGLPASSFDVKISGRIQFPSLAISTGRKDGDF